MEASAVNRECAKPVRARQDARGACRTLSQLGFADAADPAARIYGLSEESGRVGAGFLFAALPGTRVHGANYAAHAVGNGAVAVLTDGMGARMIDDRVRRKIQLLVSESPRSAFAGAASNWFGEAPGTLVAVTGTNGKTSVATMCRQLWQALGKDAANCGTTGIEGAYSARLGHTTPDPVTLHRHLAAMKAEGVDHAALEASSHGLSQRRLDGLKFNAAAFTNLSHEHLDYHPDLRSYFDAKAGLFKRNMADGGTAAVCVDSEAGRRMAEVAKRRGLGLATVGCQDADIRLESQTFDSFGQEIAFEWRGEAHGARLRLAGGFQALNALIAAALLIGTGEEPSDVFGALEALEPVRGRMELAARRRDGSPVFVDYAHTPGGLETALTSVRPHIPGRLLLVFGAGGDRDRAKRPLMGEVAARLSERQFVTDDNPRSEDPAAIRSEIMSRCPGATEIGDRAEAILTAVGEMRPGDGLIIAGKGHEAGQQIGDSVLPFNDSEQASIAVRVLEGRGA